MKQLLPVLAVLAVGALGACSETRSALSPTAPTAEVSTTASGLTYTVASATSTLSVVIDSLGGTITAGAAQLSFPKGAVSQATTITVERDGERYRWTFGPHGTAFPASAQPVLKIDYRDAAEYTEATLRIVYTDAAGNVLETLPTTVDTAAKTATAKLEHFSTYVLASD